MTRADVETIIGARSGDYGTGNGASFVRVRDDHAPPKQGNDGYRYSLWVGRTHVIGVEFDDDFQVVGKDLGEVQGGPWWQRLLEILGIR
jgi:hypothetical protein